MKQEKWNSEWKFWEDKNVSALVWNIPDIAEDITLPHDAMIEGAPRADSPNKATTGYRDGGTYTYVKLLELDASELEKKMIIRFDGVYCRSLIYVNQQLAAAQPYGYSTFYADITPWLREGVNEIRVQVRNAAMTNSRWYSGSGIYRDVWMLTSDRLYIEPDMVQIRTESADSEMAVINVSTPLANERLRGTRAELETRILDGNGNEVASGKTAVFVKSGGRRTAHQRLVIPAPSLWSEDAPYLYSFESRLSADGLTADSTEGTFGIRTLDLDPARGLRVNGNTVDLRGSCIHHDSGILGAATYEDAQRRQIARLKEAGFNAVRIAHHPAAPALLKACDELGMYVMDELTDMWTQSKTDVDYAQEFLKCWKDDAALMIRKDFNHPSVIMYSIGNEIPEIGQDEGSGLCAEISEFIHYLDDTRFTTAGINGLFAAGDRLHSILDDVAKELSESGDIEGSVNDVMTLLDTRMDQVVCHEEIGKRLETACDPLDIAGYNYMAARYEQDFRDHPDRVMVGSETYPPEIHRNWELVKRLPCVIGDFTWTGWDYIGEAGIGVIGYAPGEGGFDAVFPCQLAYCGDIDLTGYRRPLSYYREIVFGLRNEPYIAVQDPHHHGEEMVKTPWAMSDAVSSWSWGGCESDPVTVEVYSDAEEVELLVNGISEGRKKPEACRALFETTYRPGELTAKAYAGGAETRSFTLRTAAEPELIIKKDWEGSELIYLDVELRDGDGNLVTDRDETITVAAEGTGILAAGSGDPKPGYNYNEQKTGLWNGRAQIILSAEKAGGAAVSVTSASGLQARISL